MGFFSSVHEQPMKIPFIAGAVLAAHSLKPELGSEIVVKAAGALQKHIDTGAWREVKLLIRFLGILQPLYEGDGIFPLLEELFARAVDLQTASSEDVS
jgi:nuclear cap-binding protein subunit 1